MIDYSKLSDFEINCDVLAVFNPDIKHMCLSADNLCFYDCGPAGDGWNQIDIPDYCNNPADAWPIIEANNIAVIPYRHTLPQAWPTAFGVTSRFTNEDEKPLRAAMIVILKLQESANVPANSTGSDLR